MFLRSTIIRSYQYTIVKRHLYSNYPNNLKTKPDANDTAEFIYNSIKVIVLSSVIWGFESNRKYHLHHLEVNDRILSNFSECLKRHNTNERCHREKRFLQYIFKPEY